MATYLLTQLVEGKVLYHGKVFVWTSNECDPYITVPGSFLNLQVVSMSYQIHYFNGGIGVTVHIYT